MAPLFHFTLMKTAFVKANPNLFGSGVDVAYGALGASMAFVKDAMEALSTAPVSYQSTRSSTRMDY